MGSFVFKWPHPDAKDVHVTGTFDDWGKSEQLHKIGDFWEKEVNLPSADEKYYYKFVVDDDWVIDPTAPQEDDGHGNINNVLLPKDIKRHAAGSTGAAAAAVPSSSKVENATPGGFPETPANEQQQAFGVAPIPASSGIGNPIKLAPGEKVPEQGTVTDHTVDSTASTSKEGYERDASAALPAAGAVTGMGGLAALVGSVFSRNENKQNVIPESSLPMGGDKKDTMDSGPHIQSAAPNSSTAALAAGVPLEEKRDTRVIDSADTPQTGVETAAGVPEPVKESISEAQQSPEAAGSAEAVKEKSAMEQELLKKTTTSEPTDTSDPSPADQSSYYGLATQVPPTVEKSMQQAHVPPEAAADSSAVTEKSAMENELLKKVPSSDVAGEPAPTVAAATSETAPSATANTPATGAASGFTTDEKVAGGAVGGMAAAGVVTAFASSKEKEPEVPQAVPASETAPTGSKEDPVPTTDSLSKDEKVAGGAAGGMAAAGTVGALASNKEKEQEASQAVPASGSTPIGSKDAAVPTTDSLSEKEKVAGGAVGGMAAAGTVGALASSEGAGQTSTSGGAPPSDQPAGAIGTLGGKSSAAAAVADGTDSAEVPTASKAPVALEKTEGDAAEYAPVPATKTVPGVSPIAAAAMSDGTEDPTLADEPAVKMMQQDETNDLGTGAASAHEATTTTGVQAKEASSAVASTSNRAETTTAPLSTSDAGNATTGNSGLTAAAGTTTATTGAGNEMFAPHRGSVSAYDSGDRAAATAAPTSDKKEERTSTMGPTGSGTMRTTPGASSTPVKKTAAGDISTSSPASSANTKERKKRNRLSRLYHKLID